MFDFVRFCQIEYKVRLAQSGIPSDPAARTADQEVTATFHRWAVINEILIQFGSLDPLALERKDA